MRALLPSSFALSLLCAVSAHSQIPASLEEAAAQHGEVGPEKAEPTLPTTTTTTATTEVESVGEWRISELRSARRTPSGAETNEACGYERDVIVRRGADVTPAVLVVACESKGGLLAPAAPTLRLPPPFGTPVASASDDVSLDVEVGAGLSSANVVAVVTALKGAIVQCHRDTGGPQGTLRMRAVVDATGKVSDADGADGTLKGTITERCIAQIFREATFEAPRDGSAAVVTTSMTFPLRGPGVVTTVARADEGLSPCAPGAAPTMSAGRLSCLPPPPPPPKAVPAHPCVQGEIPKGPAQLGPGEKPCFVVEVERKSFQVEPGFGGVSGVAAHTMRLHETPDDRRRGCARQRYQVQSLRQQQCDCTP